MILDQFDQYVLSASGRAEDILAEFYGIVISQNSAKKYLAGIRKHLKHKQQLVDPNQTNNLSETVTKGDGSVTTRRMVILSQSDANDPTRIMELMGYDPLKWELVSCKTKRNDWDVTMKVDDKPHRETNHQYRIELSVKPLQAVLTTDYIAQVFEELQPPKITAYKYKPGRLMLELPIMDLHLGKIAWAQETGNDYDLKIAAELYEKTVSDILAKWSLIGLPLEIIAFPVGQDFYHVDTPANTTTAGTQMDVDTRWQKMYQRGVELLFQTTESLRKLAPVHITYVPGNHDTMLSYCAVYSLASAYRDCKEVIVDVSPTPRKYLRYGVNLIGYSHGKEGKRIEHLMQQERASDWGQTTYHEWHLGDLHHEEAKEIGGVKIRRISSITATDAWHAEKGFRSIRTAQAFIWDRHLGRQFVIDSNVEVQ